MFGPETLTPISSGADNFDRAGAKVPARSWEIIPAWNPTERGKIMGVKINLLTKVVVIVQDHRHSFPEPITTCSFREARNFVREVAEWDEANFRFGQKRPKYATITVRRLSDGASLDRHIFKES